MKIKQLLSLGMSTLVLVSLLCACQAPAKDSESESQVETENTTSPYTSWEELLNSFLPEINTGESVQWEGKISDGVYDGTIHDNGKYLVCLSLIEPPRSIVPQLCEARYQFDGVRMTESEGWMIYQSAFLERFIELYVDNPQDVCSSKSCIAFGLYASKEEIELYAKCPRVTRVSSGDTLFDPNEAFTTDVIG